MNRIFAMLPCYNEEQNIEALIHQWLDQGNRLMEEGFKLTIVGIDDKSKDRTKEIIQGLADRYENVVLVAHEVNKNLGGGLSTGFDYFIANGQPGDLCVLMDGDNTHDPKYVHAMISEILRGSDCVIASRYRTGSETKGVPGIRLFLSGGARFYYTLMLGVKNVRDYTCGYRVYTYKIIQKAKEKFGDNLVEMKNFSCMMEVLYKLSLTDAHFSEVPFVLRYDQKEGESKMRIFRTVKDSLLTAAKLRFSGR